MLRASKDMSWYSFACAFTDLKWPRVAATTRRTHAEALTAVTTAMLTSTRGQPNGKLLRAALKRWAFNTARRDDPRLPRRHPQRPALGRQPHPTRVRAARPQAPPAGPRRPHGQARRHPGRAERDQPAAQDPPRRLGVRRRAGAARQEPDAGVEVDAAQDHPRYRPAAGRQPDPGPHAAPRRRPTARRPAPGRVLRLPVLRRPPTRGSDQPRQAQPVAPHAGLGRAAHRTRRALRRQGVDRQRPQPRPAPTQAARPRGGPSRALPAPR